MHVELRELLGVRLGHVDVLELQPLPAEILYQRRRLRILQHPPDLRRQHRRLPELAEPRNAQRSASGMLLHKKY